MVLLDDSHVGFERNTPHFEIILHFPPRLCSITDTKHGGLRGAELRPYAFFLFTSVFLFYLRGFIFHLRAFFFLFAASPLQAIVLLDKIALNVLERNTNTSYKKLTGKIFTIN